ncbi:MAG: 8-oxo-dGTP diphosphatase [Clostridiales bacterium]|nr:8-oxo-dGTP diphosphatase [Clostridiales bacterium]
MKFQRTTLCYISKGDEWLFIHKKRKGDQNQGKYLGIGGHIEEGETPLMCIKREIKEETGLDCKKDLKDLKSAGIIMFESDIYGKEEMNVFTAVFDSDKRPEDFTCDEGELIWIEKARADSLPVWEGDKIMFDYLRQGKVLDLCLQYEGDKLINTSKLHK